MAYVLCYTKKGIGCYDKKNYPNNIAYNCDWEHSMHLAISDDGINFTPLRNNTGILFPKASYSEGKIQGTTKTLLYPWIFRMKDDSFGVLAVRRNQNATDPLSMGCMMLFTSQDLVHYEESGFLKLGMDDIYNPKCQFEVNKDAYYLEWEMNDKLFCGYTKSFNDVFSVEIIEVSKFEKTKDYDIEDALCGNVIQVSEKEAKLIRGHFDVIKNIGVKPCEIKINIGSKPIISELPKATFLYSDGSIHEKIVRWNEEEYDLIDFSKEGTYEISGEVYQKQWDFPIKLSHNPKLPDKEQGIMSDPCVMYNDGKYYLTSTGGNQIAIRVSDSLEGVFMAEPIFIPLRYEPLVEGLGTWAAELHFIKGIPYLFFALALFSGEDSFVKAYVLKCNGDPAIPENWSEPHLCVKPDGSILTQGGISLDMTYFCDKGVHYVMWSDRKVPNKILDFTGAEPADIYIATINPDEPWKTTSQPQCVIRPMYGWDRYETEVDEGAFLLRHGEDLFISISGSSTGMADLYDIGFLRAKSGVNLLDKASWELIPYPFLTKESVKNQYGPGHNCFVKDSENGDDLILYHAVPHDEDDKALGRRPGIRRVHWAATGLPYLEMTPKRDIAVENRKVNLKIIVK